MKKIQILLALLLISILGISQNIIGIGDTATNSLQKKYTQGGLTSVLDKTALFAMPVGFRSLGMNVMTTIDDSVFFLKGGIQNSNWTLRDYGSGSSSIEVDPTVSAWAKSSIKPSYSYSELTGTALGDNLGNHIAGMDLNMNNHNLINLNLNSIPLSGNNFMIYDGSTLGVYPFSSFSNIYLSGYVHLDQDETLTGIKTFQANTNFLSSGTTTISGPFVSMAASSFSQDLIVHNLTIGSAKGTFNTVLGYQALSANLGTNFGGISNTAIGYQSLFRNIGNADQVGMNNTAVGYQSGQNNTTGGYNVFIGYNSGRDIVTGSKNTIIGNAATSSTYGDVSNNIIITDGAGNIGLQVNALHVPIFPGLVATAPTSATATGTKGEIRVTSTAIYVCIATNTWVKSTLTTF